MTERVKNAAVAVVSLGAAVLLIAGPGLAADIEDPDYLGHLVGDRDGQSEIRVKIARRPGQPAYALFELDGLKLVCEDGSSKRVNSRAFRYRFLDRRTFYGDNALISSVGRIYRVVKGKLTRDGREIRGYVSQFENVSVESGGPDCASAAREHWHVERVIRAGASEARDLLRRFAPRRAPYLDRAAR